MKSELLSSRSDPAELARQYGLHYIPAESSGFRRIRLSEKKFRYVDPRGRPVKSEQTLTRIRSLAIPPAYESVWIATDPKAHLQAVGRDARGRKQYRYHPKWSQASGETKFVRILSFARALPKIRQVVSRDLLLRGMPKKKILAAIVRLLDKTLIRVGNDEYAKTNRSYGLSTLRNRHVEVKKSHVTFKFKGKSGVYHEIDLADRKIAQIVKSCRDLPGQELFQYLDSEGNAHAIHSQDVNEYLHSIVGTDFTAKDFRTWAGTVLAAMALRGMEPAENGKGAQANLNRAIETVAAKLGNTKAVCRKAYIHPAVMDAYLAGEVIGAVNRRRHPRSAEEYQIEDTEEKRVLHFLLSKSKKKRPLSDSSVLGSAAS